MEQKHKAKTQKAQLAASASKIESGVQVDPAIQKQTELRQAMRPLLGTSVVAQRQAIAPIFQVASLQQQQEQYITSEKQSIQRAIESLGNVPQHTIGPALQRQLIAETPLPIIKNPRTVNDLITVMRQRTIELDGKSLGERDRMHFTTFQRHVAANINQAYRQDRQSSEARNNQYGEMLASLHDHPASQRVSTAVLTMIPKGDQPKLQRALDEALQRKHELAEQDQKALELHTLQKKQAELQQEAEQSILERLQAKRGGGSSLPASVKKHLEQGLNADLSKVRIHNDTEADKLAKSVNAIAFTTGQDIFFQSGKYDPNSQTGLELLAHEVTHTVQQGKGKVPKGIDPDAGLEQEAQNMGKKLSTQSPKELKASSFPKPQSKPHKTDQTSPINPLGQPSALQKTAQQIQAGSPIQPSKLRSMVLGEKPVNAAIQRAWWNPIDWAKAGIEKAKEVLMQALQEIPGYKQVCQVFGKDLATGKPLDQKADSIMETIASWMPGPVRDVIKALKETNVIGKAWQWFKGEFSKLNIAGLLGEIKNSIIKLPPSIGKAVDAVTSRVDQVKKLIVGSGQKLAEIGHTGLTALISSDLGKRVVNGLRGGFETILDIFKNPLRFIGHLFKALKGGFQSFANNAGTHLKNGVGKWLTGSTGIAFPTTLNATGLFMTAISVIGFGYNNLRPKLVKHLGKDGEKKIAFAEKASDGALSSFKTMKSGIHKAREMKSSRKNIGNTMVKNVVGTVTKTVVTAAITKLATMLIPGGGFITAIVGAFNTIQAIIDQGKNIASMIGSALSGVQAIAKGQVGGAVKLVESTLAKGIPIALAFLSRIIGAGNIGGKIKQVIQKAKDSLNKVLDKIVKRMAPLINKVVTKIMNTADKAKKFVKDKKEAFKNTAKKTIDKGKALVKDGAARVRNRFKGGRAKSDQVDTMKNSPRKETGGNQNQVDTSKRAKSEMQESLNKAILESQTIATSSTWENTKEKLPSIRKKYNLKQLKLVPKSLTRFQVFGSINPKKKSPEFSLKGVKGNLISNIIQSRNRKNFIQKQGTLEDIILAVRSAQMKSANEITAQDILRKGNLALGTIFISGYTKGGILVQRSLPISRTHALSVFSSGKGFSSKQQISLPIIDAFGHTLREGTTLPTPLKSLIPKISLNLKPEIVIPNKSELQLFIQNKIAPSVNAKGYTDILHKHSEQALWQMVRNRHKEIAQVIKSLGIVKLTDFHVDIHSEREMCGFCAATSNYMLQNLSSEAPAIHDLISGMEKNNNNHVRKQTNVTSTYSFTGRAPREEENSPSTTYAGEPTGKTKVRKVNDDDIEGIF